MFLWYDYFILSTVLLMSTLIGIYFGYFGTKQATRKEYLSGGKNLKMLPIALSVVVSHFSAITLVGIPADVYKYGAYYWFICISAVIIISVAALIFYPALFKENVSSINEYLEKRFDHRTRTLGAIMYIVFENLVMPVVVYTPALCLSVVTGLNIHGIAILICGVCVFYTAIGGLKTVIWTDILQFIIILIVCLTIGVIGLNRVGGFAAMWNTAVVGERLDIFDFDLDPTKKDSFWICVLGFVARFLYYICLSQASVQKYLSLPNLQDCKRSLVVSGFGWAAVNTCAVLLGLIIYGNYANCDPVLSQKITKNDQIVSYYVQQLAESVPGISGLFMAALMSAGVSTLSSSLNALSGVIYNDLIHKFLKKDITEETSVNILKLIVVIEGVVCTSMVLVIQHMGEIISLAIGITGLIDGPSLGLFTLGVLFPIANATGALYGVIGGMLSISIIYFPSFYYQYKHGIAFSAKPLSVDGCNTINATLSTFSENSTLKFDNVFKLSNETLTLIHPNQPKQFFLFRISYNYYCLIGAMVTIILGLIISWSTRNQYSPVKRISSAKHLQLQQNHDIERELQSLTNS